MAANAEEHHTAVEAPDPAVIIVPAEHHTATKRKERDKEQEEEEEEEEEEKEIGSKKRMKCQLALEKESVRGNGFSFDTKIAAPIETTPKFGSFNSSADLLDLGLGTTTEEKKKTGGSEEITGGALDQEESGSE